MPESSLRVCLLLLIVDWQLLLLFLFVLQSAVFSKMSAAKSSLIHRLGKSRIECFHGVCPKPGISKIIGPLIKTNYIFVSVRTIPPEMLWCGIKKFFTKYQR